MFKIAWKRGRNFRTRKVRQDLNGRFKPEWSRGTPRVGFFKKNFLYQWFGKTYEKGFDHLRDLNPAMSSTRAGAVRPRLVLWKVALFLVLVGGGVCLAKVPLLHMASAMGVFRVERISIYGCHKTTPAEIRKASGIEYSDSLFLVSEEEVLKDLQSLPWVKKAELKKIWPNEVVVDIDEYTPVAMMVVGAADGGHLIYVTAKGQKIAEVCPDDDLDLPVITGLEGMLEKDRNFVMTDILSFLKYVDTGKIRPVSASLPADSISELHFSPVKGLILRLVDNPFPIYLGQGDIYLKYKKIRTVLAKAYKRDDARLYLENVNSMEYIESSGKMLITRTGTGERNG